MALSSSSSLLLCQVVSPDDVDKLYHSFLRLDADGNGVIDRDELLKLPAISGNPLAPRLLELFDTDRSGDINFAEFVTGLAVFSSKASQERRLRCKFTVGLINQLLMMIMIVTHSRL